MATNPIPDLRSSVRFPLHLPLKLRSEAREQVAETHDISSGGVMFHAEFEVPVGTSIEFTIAMPAKIIGSNKDVLVNCVGRVVRCFPRGDLREVAAVIDEYRFVR